MRNFLTDIQIVGAMSIYRCFDINEMSMEDLTKYCDRVLIMLDNYDEQCEKKVLEFQKKYDNVKVVYSKLAPVAGDKSGQIYRRIRGGINNVREQVLRELEKMNKEQKIDLLLYPDPDEIFVFDLPKILTDFWESKKSALYCGMMSPFNDFKTLREPSMFAHARIYKYRPDLTAVNARSRCFYRPYMPVDVTRVLYSVFHLAYFTKESRASRDFHRGVQDRDVKLKKLRAKCNIYMSDKDVRTMTRRELKTMLKGPYISFGEYLDKYNIEY